MTVRDAGGNAVTASSASVTLSLASNPGSATLSGTLTVSAVSGVATFSNLSLNSAASGYTLQATAAGLTGAVSTAFNITAPPSGIAYDTDNGTLNQRDLNVLIKGFTPRNPHLGDAIVATFIWTGPATITSVTDVQTDASLTPVGNTYHLVDQVSAGGITMATYVATNVQNFPDPNPNVIAYVAGHTRPAATLRAQ